MKIRFRVLLLLIVALILSTMSIYGSNQPEKLTLDKATQMAVTKLMADQKLEILQSQWNRQINNMKEAGYNQGKDIELDDKHRNFKKYLEESDYKAMRDNLVFDEALDYLFMNNIISINYYIECKVFHKQTEVFVYYNDNELLKQYYEFQLEFMPEEYMSYVDRINMLQSKETGLTQLELQIKKQTADLESEKEKAGTDVYKAFTDYIIAQKNVDCTKNNYEAAQKTYIGYEKKYELGLISQLQLKQAEYAYSKNKHEYERAQNNLLKFDFNIREITSYGNENGLLIDTNIKLIDNDNSKLNDCFTDFEKNNLSLFVLKETTLNPAIEKLKIAESEVSRTSQLYKDIADEKSKAEIEYLKYKQSAKNSIKQQVYALLQTDKGITDSERTLVSLKEQIKVMENQYKKGFITELDLLKTKNSYNTLMTNTLNLKYTKAYQWKNLQFTIKY